MNEGDQRVCNERHDRIDEEIKRVEFEVRRVRERLDGNGSAGVCARLKSIEDQMPNFTELQKAMRQQTMMLVGLSLIVGADVVLKVLPYIKALIV